jgi:hypothetical protein
LRRRAALYGELIDEIEPIERGRELVEALKYRLQRIYCWLGSRYQGPSSRDRQRA